ncbi:hypothetical protein BJ878DRAFT_489054 [Calycina marina]|uniref:Uncharacterized protein n=1 Tax=Calycina marina TaxID=1763456 RepID=A0A9P7ZB72_9HELO|nr:hypothetical protein BJ878DRAFT_489054 [Calycina marina]
MHLLFALTVAICLFIQHAFARRPPGNIRFKCNEPVVVVGVLQFATIPIPDEASHLRLADQVVDKYILSIYSAASSRTFSKSAPYPWRE